MNPFTMIFVVLYGSPAQYDRVVYFVSLPSMEDNGVVLIRSHTMRADVAGECAGSVGAFHVDSPV